MRLFRFAVLTFLLVFIFNISLPSGAAFGEVDLQAIPESFQKVAENGALILYADKSNGDFAVIDSRAGSVWWSNPPDSDDDKIARGLQKMDLKAQLLLNYVDIATRSESSVNTFTGSVGKEGMSFQPMNNGFRAEYSFPQKKSRVAMEVSLKNGYLEVHIPVDQIVESRPELIYSISVLPFFGAGSNRTNGYMLVPDGSGALIYYNSKQTLAEYKQSLYGKDYAQNMIFRGAVEQEAKMPVFGAQNGSCGFIAVVTAGDAQGTVNARVSGAKSSYNTVFCDFSLRTSDTYDLGRDNQVKFFDRDKIGLKDITIRYYLLSGTGCDYNAMAVKYRDYLTREMGVRERGTSKDIPLYIELYGAIRKNKSLLGIPVVSTQPLTGYTSALELLKNVKSKGIGDIVLKYTNANKDNVKGTQLSGFQPEPKLGSRKQLLEMISYCSSNNIVFAPNAELLYFKKGFLGISVFFDAVRTLSGAAAMQYSYRLSTDRVDRNTDASYLITPSGLYRKAEGFIDSFAKCGFDSISLDTLGKVLYSDFYKGRSNRQEGLGYMQKTVESIAKNLKNVVMSSANAYVLPYSGYIEDSPQSSSQFDIIDEDIPFYQLVLSGLISYSTPAVNLSADTWDTVLTAIENGSSLKYTWITGDTAQLLNSDYSHLYGLDYTAWLESAAEMYKKVNEVYKMTNGTNIIRHRIISHRVRETTYANGARVIVNYNDAAVTVGGKHEVRPESFVVFQGGVYDD